LPAPQHGASAQDVAAHPMEGFLLVDHVGIQAVVVPELPVVLGEPAEAALDGVVALVQLAVAVVPERVMPRRLVLALVVADVLDLPAALEHERLEPVFGELLGGPAAGDPGTDHDGIEIRRHRRPQTQRPLAASYTTSR